MSYEIRISLLLDWVNVVIRQNMDKPDWIHFYIIKVFMLLYSQILFSNKPDSEASWTYSTHTRIWWTCCPHTTSYSFKHTPHFINSCCCLLGRSKLGPKGTLLLLLCSSYLLLSPKNHTAPRDLSVWEEAEDGEMWDAASPLCSDVEARTDSLAGTRLHCSCFD